MKPGQASKTAVLVCMGRAIADGRDFSDPTAFALLPDDARATVERVRAGVRPKGLRAAMTHGYLVRQSQLMVVRTGGIDDAIREAGHRQVVILGAGLDGRAWRMEELADAVVFEVDHPDSQRDKRARAEALRPKAREVRFVPVDFACDDLEAALAKSGHDPAVPTTWIWEGVVMYLARRDIEATLAVVARRSAAGSRLVVLYHRPALMLAIIGLVVHRVGEPLRSAFTPDQMRAMLARHGFQVARDRSAADLGAEIPALAEAMKPIKHLRLVTADKHS